MVKTKLGCFAVMRCNYMEVAHVDVLLHNIAQAPLQREKGLADALVGLDAQLTLVDLKHLYTVSFQRGF